MSTAHGDALDEQWFTTMADTQDEGIARHAQYVAHRSMSNRTTS